MIKKIMKEGLKTTPYMYINILSYFIIFILIIDNRTNTLGKILFLLMTFISIYVKSINNKNKKENSS